MSRRTPQTVNKLRDENDVAQLCHQQGLCYHKGKQISVIADTNVTGRCIQYNNKNFTAVTLAGIKRFFLSIGLVLSFAFVYINIIKPLIGG